jgi:hypothetical protein
VRITPRVPKWGEWMADSPGLNDSAYHRFYWRYLLPMDKWFALGLAAFLVILAVVGLVLAVAGAF